METLLLKIPKTVCRLVCFLLAAYMVYKQASRHFRNNDASSISFKEFNKNPQDRYPTFTFCLKSRRSEMYYYFKNSLKAYGIGHKEYDRLLEGIYGMEEVRHMDIQNISAIDHEDVTLKLQKDVLRGFGFRTKNCNNSVNYGYEYRNNGKYGHNDCPETRKWSGKLPFYVSHQDPKRICFTREGDFNDNEKREEDWLLFDWETLKEINDALLFQIYVHHPGQLTRVIGKPTFESAIRDLSDSSYLALKLSQVSILRRRPDANAPCNIELQDDESRFRKEIVKNVGCVPPYWKTFMPNDSAFGDCKKSTELVDIYRYIIDYEEVFDGYVPPCDEMSLVVPFNVKTYSPEGRFYIQVTYMEEHYQEIVNVEDFGFESFWANTGGFIGIFLGFSLFQITELIDRLWMVGLCRKMQVNPEIPEL